MNLCLLIYLILDLDDLVDTSEMVEIVGFNTPQSMNDVHEEIHQSAGATVSQPQPTNLIITQSAEDASPVTTQSASPFRDKVHQHEGFDIVL